MEKGDGLTVWSYIKNHLTFSAAGLSTSCGRMAFFPENFLKRAIPELFQVSSVPKRTSNICF
jgi:hypothetical protein